MPAAGEKHLYIDLKADVYDLLVLPRRTAVWVLLGDSDRWQPGVLLSVAGHAGADATCTVELRGSSMPVDVAAHRVAPANPDILAACPDITRLSHLNAPCLAHNLEARARLGDIHTAAGSEVLVVVNPCRPVPALYTRQVAASYAQDPCGQPPHIFGVAARAYRDMATHGMSQALVVSGESGAGKTETTKRALQFFAQLAGGSGVEQRVLESNPVLEAFGNAKTQRNHNSSRFGKLITLHFYAEDRHRLAGANIHTYLLEKSRVVAQLEGERSFHIFYQLVRGASTQERVALRLPESPEAFAYLTGGGCTSVQGMDDAQEFASVTSALSGLGLSQEEQQGLWRLLAAIMWLGNVQFEGGCASSASSPPTSASPSPFPPTQSLASSSAASSSLEAAATMAAAAELEAACVAPGNALATAAELLGVDAASLARAITSRTIHVNGSDIIKPLLPHEAVDARDALAKAMYATAFDWLVGRINAALDAGGSSSEDDSSSNGGCSNRSGCQINILDIFGFEVFQSNSFEQLCINTANEHLQQQFNRHLLAAERDEYLAEGLDVAAVAVADNADCLELLDAAPPKGLGLLTLLDEQCRLGNSASDEQFLRSAAHHHKHHTRFSLPRMAVGHFEVQHTAGGVRYRAQGLVAKNRDLLSPDLIELAASSNEPLVKLLPHTTMNAPHQQHPHHQQQQPSKQHKQLAAAGAHKAARSATVAGRFVRQLRQLMGALDGCGGLQFVRCIKPNAALAPGVFDQAAVINQLRCSGVLEVARIARSAYPTRMPIHAFVARYGRSLPGMQHWQEQQLQQQLIEQPQQPPQQQARQQAQQQQYHHQQQWQEQDDRQACMSLLSQLGVAQDQYLLGKARVFLRAGALGLVESNWARLQRIAVVLQACARRWRVRTRVRQQARAAVALQCAWRGCCARKRVHALKQQHAAVLCIQSVWRGCCARKQARALKQQQAAVLCIQSAWRGCYGRARAHNLQQQQAAAVCIQAAWRAGCVRADARALRADRQQQEQAVLVIQAAWRAHVHSLLQGKHGPDSQAAVAATAACAAEAASEAGSGATAGVEEAEAQPDCWVWLDAASHSSCASGSAAADSATKSASSSPEMSTITHHHQQQQQQQQGQEETLCRAMWDAQQHGSDAQPSHASDQDSEEDVLLGLKQKRYKLLQLLAAHEERATAAAAAAQWHATSAGLGASLHLDGSMCMVWELAAEFDATAAVMEDDLLQLRQLSGATAEAALQQDQQQRRRQRWQQQYVRADGTWTTWHKTWQHNMASVLCILQHDLTALSRSGPASVGTHTTTQAAGSRASSSSSSSSSSSAVDASGRAGTEHALRALLDVGRQVESWSGLYGFELQLLRPVGMHYGSSDAAAAAALFGGSSASHGKQAPQHVRSKAAACSKKQQGDLHKGRGGLSGWWTRKAAVHA